VTEAEVGWWLLGCWWEKRLADHRHLEILADALEDLGLTTEARWCRSRPVQIDIFLQEGIYRVLCVEHRKRRRSWARTAAKVVVTGPAERLVEAERDLRSVGL
jgi:hypothetical protein